MVTKVETGACQRVPACPTRAGGLAASDSLPPGRLPLAPVLATIALLALPNAVAQESSAVARESSPAAQEPAPVTVYSGPQGKDVAMPRYPGSALRSGGEGWVHLNFMVDTAGKPYEIVVSDSFGHPDLKRAAIAALKRSTYTPAKLGGTPLDAGHSHKYRFELVERPGVSREARTQYHRLLRLVREDEKEQADELMARLLKTTERSLYEDAWLNLAMFTYYKKWGTPQQQLQALNRAVAHETRSKYLPPKLFALAQLERFRLLVRERDYATAMMAF